MTSRVVSILNQKGGVAKTTTCANLGACLAERGLRTLVVDLDPQANLTLGLSRVWEDLPYGLHDALLNPSAATLAPIIRQVGDRPLYLVPGHMEMARCEAMLTPLAGSAFRLRRALEPVMDSRSYDWVLIDCPPSLGTLTQNAVVASTHLLVPTEPKFYSFAGIDTLNRLLVELASDLGSHIELLGILLTMTERGTNLHRTVAGEIRERFGDKVFETVIHKNIRLSEAELDGTPIIEFDSRARGAAEYRMLAEEVLARTAK